MQMVFIVCCLLLTAQERKKKKKRKKRKKKKKKKEEEEGKIVSRTLPMVSSECVSRYCDLITMETKKKKL